MPAGFPSPSGVTGLLILITVFHALAAISTTFRLWFRYHIQRIWWEDIFAAVALCFDIVCLTGMWTLTAPLSRTGPGDGLDTAVMSRQSHVASYWLLIISYTCVLWCARISIMFSIIRIVPPRPTQTNTAPAQSQLPPKSRPLPPPASAPKLLFSLRQHLPRLGMPSLKNAIRALTTRTLAFLLALMFALMWTLALATKIYACASDTAWYNAMIIQCPIPAGVAVVEVCTDVVADLILVLLPLRLLWRVKLPANQRKLLLAIFSSSILISVVSAVHTAYIVPTSSFIGGITAEIEGALSLVVCNLLVIVTFVYRVRHHGADLSQSTSDEPTSTVAGLTALSGSGYGRSTGTGMNMSVWSGRQTQTENRLTTVDLEYGGMSLSAASGGEYEHGGEKMDVEVGCEETELEERRGTRAEKVEHEGSGD
ncbi:hypothetical protein BJ138DRAFT_715638 [Hygrophoropsis aurantiaca]|uniref:Uncharacterized protein n=1 Tax=Hygrophoropsis aurantiaca TaxID=72124 RepID=A0ACB8AJH9_9AGAM|nr:hypothetical protein BJ138DRAFT_715638 [Hygrophoropsis aurantiaca]